MNNFSSDGRNNRIINVDRNIGFVWFAFGINKPITLELLGFQCTQRLKYCLKLYNNVAIILTC